MLKHNWTNEVQEVLKLQQEMDGMLFAPVSTQLIERVTFPERS
jgi:hypothetical protein